MPCFSGVGYSGWFYFSRVLHTNLCKGTVSANIMVYGLIILFFLLQFYSAKMEELGADGLSCVVSFLDFHNSCDVVLLSSLRPFPIIAWVSME